MSKGLILLLLLAFVGFAVYRKWKNLPPQTRQVLGVFFGAMRGKGVVMPTGAATDEPPYEKTCGAGASQGLGTSSVMRACAHCQLHVPEGEGVVQRGVFYCSSAHAQLAPVGSA